MGVLDNFIAAVRMLQHSSCISVFYVLWLVFPMFIKITYQSKLPKEQWLLTIQSRFIEKNEIK